MNKSKVRLIAMYLPQFHPIPENDEWWGRGFTEWTNVAKAKPLFKGHYQPHIPADLGFYDLRLPEARHAQAELASRYGIEGFCYWHYWFNGKRLLERPFNEVLLSGEPRFPFCLAWANETWSRRWLGEEKEILLKQTYSIDDDYNHIRWLMKAFSDQRYLRVEGRPLLLIYRPRDLPDVRKTTDIFRNECIAEGVPEPFLVGIDGHAIVDYRDYGFDGTMIFEPQLGVLPYFLSDVRSVSKLISNSKKGVISTKLKVYDYAEARRSMMQIARKYPTYPCIFVGWDNSPRRASNGIIIADSTPELFESGLNELVQSVLSKPYQHRLVFINAWNEWAEGNHLEPDLKHGCGYLEAVKRVISRNEL